MNDRPVDEFTIFCIITAKKIYVNPLHGEKLNLIINDQPTKTTAIIFFKVKGNVGLYKSAYTNEH